MSNTLCLKRVINVYYPLSIWHKKCCYRCWYTTNVVKNGESKDVSELQGKPFGNEQRIGMYIKPGVLFNDYEHKNRIIAKLYLCSIASLIIIFFMIKTIPPGHVGIIVHKDGSVSQYNTNADKRVSIFHIPFIERVLPFRITPVRKKITRKCITLDNKNVEVMVFLTLTANVAYATHIYSIYGINYTNGFTNKEIVFDIDQVVKKYNLEDLIIVSDELLASADDDQDGYTKIKLKEHKLDCIYKEITERLSDAGRFNKIDVKDVVSLCVQIDT